jgi:hypothetical protein
MTTLTVAPLAWGIFTLLVAANWTLSVANAETRTAAEVVGFIGFVFVYGAFVVMGVIVASRRPENLIGWLMIGVGFLTSIGNLAQAYAIYGKYTNPGGLPGVSFAAWLGAWTWPTGLLLIVPLLLLYPTGRAASARWRWVVRAAMSGLLLTLLSIMFNQGRMDVGSRTQRFDNPLGLEPLGGALSVLVGVGVALLACSLIASVVSLILRSRGARGIERQQLKIFAYAAALAVSINFGLTDLVGLVSHEAAERLGTFAFPLGMILIPLSIGVAVLRYRLFDIDVIINRTLVYGVLTALLALVYVGGVVGLGGLVREATGESSNELVIAASTLAVAALFRPARSRVQAFIDRRFYRRRYDAARTLEAFSASLRDQVSLDSLTSELLAVVRNTMQPSHVSVWLRK